MEESNNSRESKATTVFAAPGRKRFMKQDIEIKRVGRPPQVSRVMSITSGKGGVGKTSTVVNLALSLADLGKSVLLLDADLGLANIDVLLGLRPKYTLLDVFEGRRSLEDIIIGGPRGISIIPATSGVESICNLDQGRKMMLMQAIESLPVNYDYLLIDTQAGIGSDVMYFNSASSEVICVITPEPTSLTDAYALIKVLSQTYGERSFSVLVNQAASEKEAAATYNRFRSAVERFLQVEVNLLGFIPADPAVPEAVRSQKALVELFPSSAPALAFAALARRIDSVFHEYRVKGGMQFFFRQLLELGLEGGN